MSSKKIHLEQQRGEKFSMRYTALEKRVHHSEPALFMISMFSQWYRLTLVCRRAAIALSESLHNISRDFASKKRLHSPGSFCSLSRGWLSGSGRTIKTQITAWFMASEQSNYNNRHYTGKDHKLDFTARRRAASATPGEAPGGGRRRWRSACRRRPTAVLAARGRRRARNARVAWCIFKGDAGREVCRRWSCERESAAAGAIQQEPPLITRHRPFYNCTEWNNLLP